MPPLIDDKEKQIAQLSSLIGNTPLLEIEFIYQGRRRLLYAKAENLNMTGSIKDRMAFYILKKAYERGTLAPGGLIIEATSGNTGIAFAAIGRALNHPVAIFMPNWMSPERINLIRSLGADIRLVSPEEGGFLGSIRMSEELAARTPGAFLPRQFANEDNAAAHHATTGPEIWWQLNFHGRRPDAFIAGVGTGGTIMGTGRFLRGKNPNVRLYPLEPSNSPTMSTGYKVGKHRIQGISDEFIPAIIKLNELDDIIAVDDGDSIIMAQKLAAELGIAVGISSGANFIGALKVQNALGPDAVVVTVFSDDNKKYLSTDLMKTEPVKPGFLAPDVDLTGFRGFKRTCETCCVPSECEPGIRPLERTDLPACPRRTPVC
jgi:cysteine synthase A